MRYPHPSRAIMFEALLKNRMSAASKTIQASIAQSALKNTFHQTSIMKNWAVTKEFAGIAPEERQERFEIVGQLNTLAEDIMCERGRIFDVSGIADKFPRGDMTGIQLRDIQLPFNEFFIAFGQRESLAVDRSADIYFEGAYIRQTIGDDKTDFDVILVCNDPTFASDDQPIGETLKGLSRFFHIFLPGDRPLDRAVYAVSQGCDPSVLGDRFAAVTATTLAAKTILYLSGPDIDAEVGHSVGAPKKLVAEAKQMEFGSQLELDWLGFPEVTFLGRNVQLIPVLAAHPPEAENVVSFAPGF